MCLLPLPANGYGTPVRWPESKVKEFALSMVEVHILYKNVEHPKLGAYIKAEGWTLQSEEYLVFPQNHSDVVNGVATTMSAASFRGNKIGTRDFKLAHEVVEKRIHIEGDLVIKPSDEHHPCYLLPKCIANWIFLLGYEFRKTAQNFGR